MSIYTKSDVAWLAILGIAFPGVN